MYVSAHKCEQGIYKLSDYLSVCIDAISVYIFAKEYFLLSAICDMLLS